MKQQTKRKLPNDEFVDASALPSRQALNHHQARSLEIPLPPFALQKEFAERVTEIRTGQVLKIEVLDHVIIGKPKHGSLRLQQAHALTAHQSGFFSS